MDKRISTEVAKLLNPSLSSKYLQKQKDALEDAYFCRKKYPLGCAPLHTIPLKDIEKSFGVSTVKGLSTDLLYSFGNEVHQSAYSETFTFKKSDNFEKPAGIKSNNVNNTDEKMKEIFNYDKHSTTIVPSSYVNKNNSERMSAKENNAFDSIEHKASVLRERNKIKISKKAMMDKHFVEVIWNLLKIKNHENFQDLVSSFIAYKNRNDKVTVYDLQNMCQNLGLSAPLQVLEKLIEVCDIIDKDGSLCYEEFIHCLNWKDMIPENINFKTSKYASDWKECIKNPSEDLKNVFRTTASSIGDHKYPVSSRVAGQPSYTKVNKLKLKGISEFNEYGNASSMINPNVFTKYGIFEEDLNKVYTKEEIILIFMNSGIKFSDDTFERIWQSTNSNGKASMGTVWNAMKRYCLLYNTF